MKKPIKVLLASNWKHLNYKDYFPNSELMFDGVEFLEDLSEGIDAVVVLNHTIENIQLMVSPSNIFHIHQEPGDQMYHGFMFEKVIGQTCSHLPEADVTSHPCLNWLVNKTYDELLAVDVSLKESIAQKEKVLSGVISGHNALPGHYFRLGVLDKIKQNCQIDLYGKRHNFIPDKWDAIYPYQYSLAMENAQKNDYWTEKIMDCFLACTMPVYMGCPNIERYFPQNSYIGLDTDNLEYSIDAMKEKIMGGYFQDNYTAILEARELCMKKYSTAPAISKLINNHFRDETKESISILPFKRSMFTDIKRKLLRNRLAHRISGIK